jgi:hypothetical protein
MSTGKDAIDAPQEDQTIEDAYPESFEESSSDVFVAEGAEPIKDSEDEPEPEGEPEGDEPEGEPEETPETDELAPLEEEEVEEPEEKKTVPLDVMLARVAKEKAKRVAAEAEAERIRAGVPPEGAIPSQHEPAYVSEGKPPVESDFEDHSDFVAAKAAYVAKQEYLKEQAATQAAQQRQANEAAQNKLVSDYSSKVDAEVLANPEKFPDFEEDESFVTSVGLHGMALHGLMTAERPAPIIKYLAKHPEEATRIAQLPPIQQVKEIGHLEKRSLVKPKSKKVTKASEPITPERGDSSPPKPTKFSQDMSEKEYDKLKASKGASLTVGDLTGS